MFSPGSEVFLHSEDHIVFSHCDILKRKLHLINRRLEHTNCTRATCTQYCLALQAVCHYHVRLKG
jgi:hypothetical protein